MDVGVTEQLLDRKLEPSGHIMLKQRPIPEVKQRRIFWLEWWYFYYTFSFGRSQIVFVSTVGLLRWLSYLLVMFYYLDFIPQRMMPVLFKSRNVVSRTSKMCMLSRIAKYTIIPHFVNFWASVANCKQL